MEKASGNAILQAIGVLQTETQFITTTDNLSFQILSQVFQLCSSEIFLTLKLFTAVGSLLSPGLPVFKAMFL